VELGSNELTGFYGPSSRETGGKKFDFHILAHDGSHCSSRSGQPEQAFTREPPAIVQAKFRDPRLEKKLPQIKSSREYGTSVAIGGA
jgi:hypothetical protein